MGISISVRLTIKERLKLGFGGWVFEYSRVQLLHHLRHITFGMRAWLIDIVRVQTHLTLFDFHYFKSLKSNS